MYVASFTLSKDQTSLYRKINIWLQYINIHELNTFQTSSYLQFSEKASRRIQVSHSNKLSSRVEVCHRADAVFYVSTYYMSSLMTRMRDGIILFCIAFPLSTRKLLFI